MIAPSVVQEVRRLLAEGNFSQRRIAKLTGISRGTVGAIAAGRRPDYESLRPTANDELPEPSGPPQRCPGCGGMVYLPCRLCRTRALRARSSAPPMPARLMQLDEPLGLDLRKEDRARYEAIRLQRLRSFGVETSGDAEPSGEGPGTGRDDLCSAFQLEDDEWELDPADLWDAFEWEDDEPAVDYVNVQDLGEPGGDVFDVETQA
jgi:transcriptional regulator with XRE-family HTH domain